MNWRPIEYNKVRNLRKVQKSHWDSGKMNGVQTFKKELNPNGSKKEYHRFNGFATEM